MYASPYLHKIPESRIHAKREEIREELRHHLSHSSFIDTLCEWTPYVCGAVIVALFVIHRIMGGTTTEFSDAIYEGLS